MGAAVLQHVEDHLKMDNGENIHRNLNEFNSNGWDSISFITDMFDWYAKKQLCVSPCGDECVLETISFIRTYVRVGVSVCLCVRAHSMFVILIVISISLA